MGLGDANAVLLNRGSPLIYCQPRKLALTTDNTIQILDGWVKTNRQKFQDDEVAHLIPMTSAFATFIRYALQSAFPCTE